jgi:hypothetical protein
MAENKNTDLGELEKLALITESLQTMFRGKSSVILELNREEYIKILNNFREVDRHHKQFTIDMSGTDFLFILNEDML